MTNPYGITEVDVPGALNALEAARSTRIRQMLLQRQLAQEERQAGVTRDMRGAINDFFGGAERGSASAPATTPPVTSPGLAGAVDMYGGGAPATPTAAPVPDAAALAATPAAGSPVGDINRLATRLIAIDPEHAAPIISAFRQMDEAAFTAATRRNATLARAAYSLLDLPEAERSAAFQRMAPDLIENGGVTRQQLAGFELTEENLHHVINQARDVEKLAEEARPSYRNVEGEVLDERRLERGEDPVVYRSEYIATPEGLARRPGAGVQPAPENLPRPATPEAARQLAPGTRFLDPNGVVRTVPGGPTRPASGNFP